jgi:hypothetical protein
MPDVRGSERTSPSRNSLSSSSPPLPPERFSFVHWGRYDPARLVAADAGVYRTRFVDGIERWATACEIASQLAPAVGSVPLEHCVLVPSSSSSGGGGSSECAYTRATLVATAGDTWTVRALDADAAEPRRVQRLEVRLPLTSAPTIGTSLALAPGASLHVLRGLWVPCTILDESPVLGQRIRLRAPSSIEAWVSGSSLVHPDLNAQGEAEPPPPVQPGGVALALPAPESLEQHAAEVVFEELRPDGMALVSDAGGGVRTIPAHLLRPRYMPNFRVLVATGGFQRATLEAVGADSTLSVALCGGGRRWVSAAEVLHGACVMRTIPADVCSEALVAVGDGERARSSPWLPAAVHLGDGVMHRQAQQRIEARPVATTAPTRGNGLVNGSQRTHRGGGGGSSSSQGGGGAVGGSGPVFESSSRAPQWKVGADEARLGAPLLAVGSDPSPPLDLGDSVYVLIGAWREAIVESQQGDYYLVHEGGGVRRWASAGELAWHDVPPQPFDLTAGKAVIAWDARVAAYQAAVMAQQESVHGEGGGTWVVRFDCGHEASVVVGALRERWHVPVRVLCLWGNYYPATVLEALAGLLRVDFGGGHVQWALPEQTLSSHAPSAADLVIGAYVGAVRPSADPAAAAVPEAKRRYHRGSVVQLDGESRVVEVRFEDGSMHAVPLEQVRLPREETSCMQIQQGEHVISLFGEWHPGYIAAEALASPSDRTGRYTCMLMQGTSRWQTHASRREMVAADGGDSSTSAPLWRLRKGSALLMRGEHAHSSDADVPSRRPWIEVLFVGKPAGFQGMVEVMLPTGKKVRVPAKDVRARDGEAHPASRALGEARGRVARYNERAALTIQRFVRARAAKASFAVMLMSGATGGGRMPPKAPPRMKAQAHGASRMDVVATAPSLSPSPSKGASLLSEMLLQDAESGEGGAATAAAEAEAEAEAAAAAAAVAEAAAFAAREAAAAVAREASVAYAREMQLREMKLLADDLHSLATQLQRSFRKLKEEKAKDAELEALIQTAETEAAPPKPDREAQAKLRESLQKRQADLKATHSKTTQPNHAFRDAQDEKSKVQIEIAELRRQVDTGNSEARLLTKQVEHTRKVLEMEERAGSAEKAEKMYEEYSSRLAESARREAEKQKAEQDKLGRYNDDGSLGEDPPCMQVLTTARRPPFHRYNVEWARWVSLLANVWRKLQARADAGDEAARRLLAASGPAPRLTSMAAGGGGLGAVALAASRAADTDHAAAGAGGGRPGARWRQAAAAVSHEIDDAAGGAGGGFAAMAAMVAAQNARLATGIVEKVSKNDEKLKTIRQRLQELDMADAEAMSKVQQAEEKLTAHHSLTAHRAAAGSSSQAGAATPQKKSSSNEAKRSAKAAAATPKAPSLPDVVDVNSLRAARRPRAQAGEQGVADSPTVATLRARLMLAAAEDEADD